MNPSGAQTRFTQVGPLVPSAGCSETGVRLRADSFTLAEPFDQLRARPFTLVEPFDQLRAQWTGVTA